MIGIDGLRVDLAVDAGGMPTLARTAASGTRHRMVVAPPTLSGPSWSTILTGASLEAHGVTDNLFSHARLPRFPDLLSQAFAANKNRRTFAAASWTPLVDPHGIGPVIHERAEQQRSGMHHVIVRDGDVHGYAGFDGEIADHTTRALRENTPDISFSYLGEADEAGHLHGPHSEEYTAALTRIDAHVHGIISEVDQLAAASGDDWLLVITTDHGHRDEGGHGGTSAVERESFVITHQPNGSTINWPTELAPTEITPRLLRFMDGW